MKEVIGSGKKREREGKKWIVIPFGHSYNAVRKSSGPEMISKLREKQEKHNRNIIQLYGATAPAYINFTRAATKTEPKNAEMFLINFIRFCPL
jgi:hypothetical protein